MSKQNENEGMKFNPLTNLGLAEGYNQLMWTHVKEMLACREEDLTGLLESMSTTFTDDFIVECVRVAEFLRRKVYK